MARLAPIAFFRTAIEEGRKVIWPSRPVVIRHTVMVVISVAIATLIFASVDYGLQKLVIASIQ